MVQVPQNHLAMNRCLHLVFMATAACAPLGTFVESTDNADTFDCGEGTVPDNNGICWKTHHGGCFDFGPANECYSECRDEENIYCYEISNFLGDLETECWTETQQWESNFVIRPVQKLAECIEPNESFIGPEGRCNVLDFANEFSRQVANGELPDTEECNSLLRGVSGEELPEGAIEFIHQKLYEDTKDGICNLTDTISRPNRLVTKQPGDDRKLKADYIEVASCDDLNWQTHPNTVCLLQDTNNQCISADCLSLGNEIRLRCYGEDCETRGNPSVDFIDVPNGSCDRLESWVKTNAGAITYEGEIDFESLAVTVETIPITIELTEAPTGDLFQPLQPFAGHSIEARFNILTKKGESQWYVEFKDEEHPLKDQLIKWLPQENTQMSDLRYSPDKETFTGTTQYSDGQRSYEYHLKDGKAQPFSTRVDVVIEESNTFTIHIREL